MDVSIIKPLIFSYFKGYYLFIFVYFYICLIFFFLHKITHFLYFYESNLLLNINTVVHFHNIFYFIIIGLIPNVNITAHKTRC